MSNDSLRRFTHREAVALFHSGQALIEAADALQAEGVDRAHLSILGSGTNEETEALNSAGFRTLRDVLQKANVPPEAHVPAEDVAKARSAPVSRAIYVGATRAAATASDSAEAVLTPIVAAVAASAAAGGSAHAFLLFRLLDRPETYAEATLAQGGLVLWALLENDELEVAHVLHKAGGELLRVQDIPFERQMASDPLARRP